MHHIYEASIVSNISKVLINKGMFLPLTCRYKTLEPLLVKGFRDEVQMGYKIGK